MRYVELVLLAGVRFASCGRPEPPPPPPPPECAPGLPVCPDGAFSACEDAGVVVRTSCCAAMGPISACAVDAGILSNTCPICPASSGVCAIAGDGHSTCDAFGQHDAGSGS